MRAILAIIASAAVAVLVLVRSAPVEGTAVEGTAVAKVEYFFGAA